MTFKPYPKESQLKRERKRARRKIASPKQWQAMRSEKCFRSCRVCGIAPPADGHDAHHLVPRGRDGDDTYDNLIGLCRDCHNGIENRNRAHVRRLLERLTDAEYAYAVEKCGEGWAESVYGVEYER